MSGPAYTAAPDAAFFTPAQHPPVGTALVDNPPTLFSPLTLRGLTFQNRIWVAPMCMYSAHDGFMTPFHLVHLGAFAYRGASLTIMEATAVQANGRITPQDVGLWSDAHIAGLKQVADFMHSQGQKLGIQLAHAGRKASTMAPWLVEQRGATRTATVDDGGWPGDVVGPSPIVWGDGFVTPREMTLDEIKGVVDAFRDAAVRSITAGVDVIEIHGAHGYLITEFLSPLSNQRQDAYGGSFENRTRLLVEIIEAVRGVIPATMPLLVRVSATEWMEDLASASWTVEDTIRLAKLLPGLGVDLLDVSSGGNHKDQKVTPYNNLQTGIAARIRQELHAAGITDLKIGAVGMITEAELAKDLVQSPSDGLVEVETERGEIAKADIVLVARQFLREPEWVLRVAHRLGVEVRWPQQYHRGGFMPGTKI